MILAFEARELTYFYVLEHKKQSYSEISVTS